MKTSSSKAKSAFTLIELIIVIAIIAILAGAIFVAIDPARRLHESRNAVRSSDTATILEALKKYQTDNDGAHLTSIAGLTADQYSVLGTATSGCNSTCTAQTTQASCADISALGATYLGTAPVDPLSGTATNSDYYVSRGASNELTVGSCDPEQEGVGGSTTTVTIEVTR